MNKTRTVNTARDTGQGSRRCLTYWLLHQDTFHAVSGRQILFGPDRIPGIVQRTWQDYKRCF
ncbi:hypothetical protein EI94DRAFT_1730915 [Lactarius quietus]|nr:hypothetical protein EI94DRAFT_1730915 [Lactarius quietus]